MDRVDFLGHRVALTGLPYGQLMSVLDTAKSCERAGSSTGSGRRLAGDAHEAVARAWLDGFVAVARRNRRRATRSALAGRRLTSVRAWLDAVRAFHVASFYLHLSERPASCLHTVRRLRGIARACYRRALAVGVGHGTAIAEPLTVASPKTGGGAIEAYLRLPVGDPSGVVVLLNGLDSLCEVEMHAFADAMLDRGIATLAVDLPCDLAGLRKGGDPEPWRSEDWTGPIADRLASIPATRGLPIAAFGVSFGGSLAARTLLGDRRFEAAVAVSPGAWLGPDSLHRPRVAAMARLAFNGVEGFEMDTLSLQLDVRGLPVIDRALRLYVMEQDELFGPAHTRAYRDLCSNLEIRSWDAEHVGTSVVHEWLPDALDWLGDQFAALGWKAVDPLERSQGGPHAQAS